jgi:chromosome segregation ATPase
MPRVSSEVKAITTQITAARLERLQNQNHKLKLEIAEKAKALVPLEAHIANVRRANATVKQQILAIPHRLAARLVNMTDRRQILQCLTEELTKCLNDLAYERDLYRDDALVPLRLGNPAKTKAQRVGGRRTLSQSRK